jgi:hypothetical protein
VGPRPKKLKPGLPQRARRVTNTLSVRNATIRLGVSIPRVGEGGKARPARNQNGASNSFKGRDSAARGAVVSGGAGQFFPHGLAAASREKEVWMRSPVQAAPLSRRRRPPNEGSPTNNVDPVRRHGLRDAVTSPKLAPKGVAVDAARPPVLRRRKETSMSARQYPIALITIAAAVLFLAGLDAGAFPRAGPPKQTARAVAPWLMSSCSAICEGV